MNLAKYLLGAMLFNRLSQTFNSHEALWGSLTLPVHYPVGAHRPRMQLIGMEADSESAARFQEKGGYMLLQAGLSRRFHLVGVFEARIFSLSALKRCLE